MDLPQLSDGPVAAKTWLDIIAGDIQATTMEATTITAGSFVGPVVGNDITLSEVASVPDPAVGKLTLYANLSGQVSTNDALGDVVTLLDNPSSQDENMNGHAITGILSETFSGDVLINKGGNFANVAIGATAGGSSSSSVLLGGFSSSGNGANQVVIGSQCNGGAGQYVVAIGEGINATGGGFSVNLGGGNTGITNPQGESVAIGNDMTLGAGNGGICLGNAAGIGAVNNAIAIGSAAVNSTASSCLIGDSAIANIRSNNSSHACDLGTSAAPFKSCWLRDSAVADACHFSMYGAVTLANSTTPTSLLTGTSAGSLVWSAGQAVGSVIRLRVNVTFSCLVTDSIVLAVKINGSTVVSQTVGLAAISAAAGVLNIELCVQSSSIACTIMNSISGFPGSAANASAAYNPAIANTLDLVGTWSAASASDSITANFAYIEALRAL